ncbi:hypothetical protein GCM10010306_093300 [Streptomyces umbrinus]|nr:hypothetical protein GCM10010306_093300 [Streptomyces umbrinus]GHH58033.1 hypothetical protein GCM10018775_66910 [Streptomyces umbrinus]
MLERAQPDKPCDEAGRIRVEQRPSAVQPTVHRISPWGGPVLRAVERCINSSTERGS